MEETKFLRILSDPLNNFEFHHIPNILIIWIFLISKQHLHWHQYYLIKSTGGELVILANMHVLNWEPPIREEFIGIINPSFILVEGHASRKP